MTIELTREQEKLIRGSVESGRYESVEAFLDEAITEAYTRTEAFKKLASEKLAAAHKDIGARRVVTVAKSFMTGVVITESNEVNQEYVLQDKIQDASLDNYGEIISLATQYLRLESSSHSFQNKILLALCLKVQELADGAKK